MLAGSVRPQLLCQLVTSLRALQRSGVFVAVCVGVARRISLDKRLIRPSMKRQALELPAQMDKLFVLKK